MSNLNATVSAGYVFTEDADSLVWPTKDRLNLLGVPTVTIPLDDSYVPKIGFTVGDLSGGVIAVALQIKTILDAANANRFKVRLWLSDAQYGAVSATAPETSAEITTGTLLEAVTANKDLIGITTPAGAMVLTITNAAAHTWYLNAEVDGRIWASDAIAFT